MQKILQGKKNNNNRKAQIITGNKFHKEKPIIVVQRLNDFKDINASKNLRTTCLVVRSHHNIFGLPNMNGGALSCSLWNCAAMVFSEYLNSLHSSFFFFFRRHFSWQVFTMIQRTSFYTDRNYLNLYIIKCGKHKELETSLIL